MQSAPFFNQAIKLMVIPFQVEDRFVHFCCIYGARKVHQLFHNNVKGYKSNDDVIVSTLASGINLALRLSIFQFFFSGGHWTEHFLESLILSVNLHPL